MVYYVISTPDTVCEPQDVKPLIVEHNTRILLGQGFPAVVPDLDPKTLIGDPEENLSDSICEMLTKHGVLSRTPVCDASGKQYTLKDGSPLWNYVWTDVSFAVLSLEELELVAWDLHCHSKFAHASAVGEPAQVDDTSTAPPAWEEYVVGDTD